MQKMELILNSNFDYKCLRGWSFPTVPSERRFKMLKKIGITAAAVAITAAAPAAANELSPIFGKTKAVSLTQSDAKAVVGKGATSLYYAYYANLYNSYAGYYGMISQFNDSNGYSSSYTYYYTASQYASYASTYYYYAYYYKVNNG